MSQGSAFWAIYAPTDWQPKDDWSAVFVDPTDERTDLDTTAHTHYFASLEWGRFEFIVEINVSWISVQKKKYAYMLACFA